MNRLARGMGVAAAASLALHAGLLATTLGQAVTGSAKNDLAYVRTRMVVAADAVETQAAQAVSPSQAPAADSSEAPRPRSDASSRPAEPPPPAAGSDSVATTPAPAELARPSDATTAAKDAANGRQAATSTAPASAAASLPSAAAAAVTTPAAAPLAGSGPDPGPALLSDLLIERPAGAGRIGGSVTLLLVLSAQGSVERASVLQSTPAGLFDEATLRAIATARFKPALRGSLPISVETVYEVEIAPLR